jgi:hypothetical protein
LREEYRARKSVRSKLTGSHDFDSLNNGGEFGKQLKSKKAAIKFSKEESFKKGTRVRDMHELFENRYSPQRVPMVPNSYKTTSFANIDLININDDNSCENSNNNNNENEIKPKIMKAYSSVIESQTAPPTLLENRKKSDKIVKMAQMLEEKLYRSESNNIIAVNKEADNIINEVSNNDQLLQITMEKPVIKKNNKISRSNLKIILF